MNPGTLYLMLVCLSIFVFLFASIIFEALNIPDPTPMAIVAWFAITGAFFCAGPYEEISEHNWRQFEEYETGYNAYPNVTVYNGIKELRLNGGGLDYGQKAYLKGWEATRNEDTESKIC